MASTWLLHVNVIALSWRPAMLLPLERNHHRRR